MEDRKKASPAETEAERENTSQAIHVSDHETADGRPAALTTEETRQGHTGDHARYILGLSILGGAIALAILFFVFARHALP